MDNFDLFRIDGHTLRVFASVCETGSVSRTAHLFDLNQSTISHTIEKMRAAVGDPLFVKSGRGITPTEKCLALQPRVQRILAEIEGLVAAERYDARYDTKPFVVAIPTPSLLGQMRALHARLLEASPGAAFQVLRLAPRDRVTEMLGQEEADIVIAVSGFRYPATLNHVRYWSDDLVVYYDPACRGPVRTLAEYSAARHGAVSFGGDVKSEVERALAENGVRRRVALVSPTASMLGGLIEGTDMIATMPRALSLSAYAHLAHAPPPLPLPEIVYDMVWHRRFEHSGRNAWLREQILATRLCSGNSRPEPA